MQAIQGKRVVQFLKREPVLTLAAVCALLSMLPVMVVYVFAQKYIIQGLTTGAVKG